MAWLSPFNPPLSDWRGKRVWLVGASSGIGLACAQALHKAGAHVCVSARQATLLQAFVEAILRLVAALGVDRRAQGRVDDQAGGGNGSTLDHAATGHGGGLDRWGGGRWRGGGHGSLSEMKKARDTTHRVASSVALNCFGAATPLPPHLSVMYAITVPRVFPRRRTRMQGAATHECAHRRTKTDRRLGRLSRAATRRRSRARRRRAASGSFSWRGPARSGGPQAR